MKCQVLCALCMVKKIDIQLLLNVYFGQTGFEPAWNRKSVRKRAATAGRFRIIEKKGDYKKDFKYLKKNRIKKISGKLDLNPPGIENPLENELRQQVVLGLSKKRRL